ncbi:MAG: hypothetical protein BWK74_01420 [Desulfobacteraceae bacterium A6]|nr:MAG: hypothetical protein BWK74_01420 [Desulfobacteraceae bacterium A6]
MRPFGRITYMQQFVGRELLSMFQNYEGVEMISFGTTLPININSDIQKPFKKGIHTSLQIPLDHDRAKLSGRLQSIAAAGLISR